MNEAHTARAADRLDSDSHADLVAFRRADLFPKVRCFLLCAETDFVEFLRKFLLEKIEDLLRLRRARRVLDAGIDVFRVFPEDHHVHFLWVLDGRGDAFEVLHWPQTNEKIQQLPQRNIERANAAAHRCSQRTFDSDQILAERFHCVVWQPFIEFVLRGLAGEDLKPRDFLFPGVRFFNRSIEHTDTCRPNIRPGPVTADERNDRLIRHIQSVGSGDLFTSGRSNIFVRHKAQL